MIVVALAAVGAGCGGSETPSTEDSSGGTEAPTTEGVSTDDSSSSFPSSESESTSDSPSTDSGALTTEDGSDSTTTGSDTTSSEPETYFGDPRCAAGDFVICESFEDAEVGGFPAGWGPRPTGNWLGNGMGVARDDAARGSGSFKLEGGTTGAQWITPTAELGELATAHWGRMFFRVQQPAPWPMSGVLHGDLFEARGPYGTDNVNRVRWGIVANTQQRFQWIYNVQRSSNEFATGTPYEYQWSDAWVCMEWHHDQATQEAALWLDEVEVEAIRQSAEDNPEIPAFDDISVGWANYQAANPQFVVYIDEVVFDDERIGCYD